MFLVLSWASLSVLQYVLLSFIGRNSEMVRAIQRVWYLSKYVELTVLETSQLPPPPRHKSVVSEVCPVLRSTNDQWGGMMLSEAFYRPGYCVEQ